MPTLIQFGELGVLAAVLWGLGVAALSSGKWIAGLAERLLGRLDAIASTAMEEFRTQTQSLRDLVDEVRHSREIADRQIAACEHHSRALERIESHVAEVHEVVVRGRTGTRNLRVITDPTCNQEPHDASGPAKVSD